MAAALTYSGWLVPTGTPMDQHRSLMEERRITTGIKMLGPLRSPALRSVVMGSMSTLPMRTRPDGMRDDVFHQEYQYKIGSGSRSMRPEDTGMLEWGDPTNQNQGPHMYSRRPITPIMPPDTTPRARTFRLTVPLRAAIYNFMLEQVEKDMDARLPEGRKQLAKRIMGYADQIAQDMANEMHLKESQNRRLFALGSVSSGNYSVGAASVRTITVTPANESLARVHMGYPVDLMKSATERVNQTSDGTRIPMWVRLVEPLKNRVTLQVTTDTTILDDATYTALFGTSNVGDNAYVTMQNSYSPGLGRAVGWAGFHQWLKEGDGSGTTNTVANTLLGADAVGFGTGPSPSEVDGRLNVNVHPQFQSIIDDFGWNPLFEQELIDVLDKFFNAYAAMGYDIDTGLSAPGIFRALERTKYGTYDNTRRGLINTLLADQGSNLKNGLEDEGVVFRFTYEGKEIPFYTDPSMEKGDVLMYKRKGNWKIVAPERMVGSTSDSQFGKSEFLPLQMLGPIINQNGNIEVTHFVNGRQSLAKEIPSLLRMQMFPSTQIPMIHLTSVQSRRVFEAV